MTATALAAAARRVLPTGAFRCLFTAAALAIVPAAVVDEKPVTAAEAAATVPVRAGYCREARITGYVRTEYSSRTYDGTSIYTDEAIAAASWDIPLGSYVTVEDLGTYRIADRGHLGSNGWIDIAVWDRPTAFAITSYRQICVSPP